MSYPELIRIGEFLVGGGATLAFVAIFLRRRWLRGAALGASALLVLCGLVACTDSLCLAGYTTEDGSCAWE